MASSITTIQGAIRPAPNNASELASLTGAPTVVYSSEDFEDKQIKFWKHSNYLKCCQSVCRISRKILDGKTPCYGTGFLGEFSDANANIVVGLITALHVINKYNYNELKLSIKGHQLYAYFPTIKYLFEARDDEITRDLTKIQESEFVQFDLNDITDIDSDKLYFDVLSDFVFFPLKDYDNKNSSINIISDKRKILTYPLTLDSKIDKEPDNTYSPAMLIQFPGAPFQYCDELCFDCGPIIEEDKTKFKIYFDISCEVGSSGSPLIQIIKNKPKVVGINIEGNSHTCLLYNAATSVSCMLEGQNTAMLTTGIEVPSAVATKDMQPSHPYECSKRKNVGGEEPTIPHSLYIKAAQAVGFACNKNNEELGTCLLIKLPKQNNESECNLGILSILNNSENHLHTNNGPKISKFQFYKNHSITNKIIDASVQTGLINIYLDDPLSEETETLDLTDQTNIYFLSSIIGQPLTEAVKLFHFYKINEKMCSTSDYIMLENLALKVTNEMPRPGMSALIITSVASQLERGFVTMTIHSFRNLSINGTDDFIYNGILKFHDHTPFSKKSFGGAVFQIFNGLKLSFFSVIINSIEAINLFQFAYSTPNVGIGINYKYPYIL